MAGESAARRIDKAEPEPEPQAEAELPQAWSGELVGERDLSWVEPPAHLAPIDPFDPIEPYARSKSGWQAICTRGAGDMIQRCHRVSEIDEAIRQANKATNFFVSRSTFREPNRRAVNIWSCSSVHVDIDMNKMPEFAGLCSDDLLHRALEFHADSNMKMFDPSLIRFSGGGLYFIWHFDHPVPRAGMGRLMALLKEACSRYLAIGADPAATDVSRVLRPAGTLNAKYRKHPEGGPEGVWTRDVWANADPATGRPRRYSFDDLADDTLAISAEKLREKRAARTAAAAERERCRVISLEQEKRKTDKVRRASGGHACWRTWVWLLLQDIEHLIMSRFPDGKVPEGQLDIYAFPAACCIALMFRNEFSRKKFIAELMAWAKSMFPDYYMSGPFIGFCKTLIERAEAASRGELVEYNGKMVTPTYTYSKATLLERFDPTAEEQRHLKALIGEPEKTERNTKAKRQATGRTGRTEEERRRQDETAANARAERAIYLRNRGMIWKAIADEMGLPSAHAAMMLVTRHCSRSNRV